MPRPKTLRDRMQYANQLGIPAPIPPSTRPPEAAPSDLRLRCAEAGCLGRPCFAPGSYQHRGATISGSRNTGAYSDCCMNRAYHGCPMTMPPVDQELMRGRKKEEGWK
jgi:hypothetical protein